MQIKIQKIKNCSNPIAEAATWDKYKLGEINENYSLPIEYEIEGSTEDLPIVGFPFRVLRTKRNGIEKPGYMITSNVTKVTDD